MPQAVFEQKLHSADRRNPAPVSQGRRKERNTAPAHQDDCLAADVLAEQAGLLKGEDPEVLACPSKRFGVATGHPPEPPLWRISWGARTEANVAQAGGCLQHCRLYLQQTRLPEHT
jgi:hypothetical protein